MATQFIPATGAATRITRSAANLPKQLVDQMQSIFGKHLGYRTTHAKGLLVEGKFTPTEQAKTLSIAPHFNNASTSVVARFSVGGGLPFVADVDDGATPKGLAVRFLTGEDTHTDLISHTFNGFAANNGEGFLAFLKVFGAVGASRGQLEAAKAKGGDIAQAQATFDKAQSDFSTFLSMNPSAARFILSPKPNPHDYGTITYYEVNTHVLTNKAGKVTNVRYRLDPDDGDHLYPNATPSDKEALGKLGNDYLEDDLRQRFPGKPIRFTIKAHIADPDDILDDATIPYKSTTFIPIGKLEINQVAENNAIRSQQIAFSPAPELGGVAGITSSGDPLIQARKGVYYISASQRRSEKLEAPPSHRL